MLNVLLSSCLSVFFTMHVSSLMFTLSNIFCIQWVVCNCHPAVGYLHSLPSRDLQDLPECVCQRSDLTGDQQTAVYCCAARKNLSALSCQQSAAEWSFICQYYQ